MKKILILILLVIVAYVAWLWWKGRSVAAADRGQAIFYDRVWVDHMPKSQTDTFQVFAAVTEEPVGIFQKASQWKGEYEIFRHEARGDGQIELLFPQSRDKARVSYRAWKCSEAQFDFCLEMSGGRGARKYFSQRGWEVGGVAGAQAIEARLAHGD